MAVGPQLANVLSRYGLQSLTEWASLAIIQGWSDDQVILALYDRPEFKQRFPAIFARESAGLPPISVDEYLDYERTAISLASTWNLPISKQEIDNLITNDVSAAELEQRFNIAATAEYESDAETRSELERLFGVTQGQRMRYWMDPKAELGTLQQQYRMGEIAGAALRAGYDQPLTASQASRLQQSGLTRNQALQGFSQLVSMQELFTPLNMGESAIDTSAQVEYLTGDADVAQMVEKRAAQRAAEFEGGGQYATNKEGFSTGKAK
jgi:hypothetical protein